LAPSRAGEAPLRFRLRRQGCEPSRTAYSRRVTLRIGASALIATAVAAAAPPSPAAPRTGNVPHRNCARAQLTVRVARWLLGTTHTGGYIVFTNRSRTACRLTGWPRLVGVTATGVKTLAAHVRSTWFGPYVAVVPVLTLRRGQTAIAAFSGSDRPPAGERTCSRAFRRLRVTPPGTAASVTLPAWFPPLGRYLPGCGRIEVSLVVRPSAFTH
jgi:Protein of unknown function (DUF4232)